jgi:hypothetical protein
MNKKIELDIVCQSCNGTGIYSGFAESKGVGVICYKCNGTGKYHYVFEYKEFKKLKKRSDIKRVYKHGTAFKLGLGKIKYETEPTPTLIDMDKEGVSYKEFLNGNMPDYVKKLECPLSADQGACSSEFKDECNKLNGSWISYIPKCKYTEKMKCWDRFEKENKK